ncbi:hypothetical protein F66182_9526 [Fusarium sp. NRRL 66182]|nr:hypothetical protein F66182_9526 [Fusarium sp. NRRL 66182]
MITPGPQGDPWEEKALIKFLAQQDALGRSICIKHVGSIAALDWKRYDIREKVIHWFEAIKIVLENPDVLQENVYNMDETGVMLSKPNSVKVLVSKDNPQGYRGARIKRTTVTAIECRLERGCVGTVGKEHFIYLYSPARDRALTSRNIRAGWAKAGLFPFSPDKVLCDIRKPPPIWIAPNANEANVDSRAQDDVPRTPSTPVSAGAVTALQKLIQEDAGLLDDTKKQRLQKHLQKLSNAAQISFAERALLHAYNQFLVNVNNEAKVRRSTKSEVLGTARVMSYEDLVQARVDRARKERAKEARRASKEGKGTRRANHGKPQAALSGGVSRVRNTKSTAPAQVAEPKAAQATHVADNEQGTSASGFATHMCPGQAGGQFPGP